MFIVSREIWFTFDELAKNTEISIGIWSSKGADETGEGKQRKEHGQYQW